jgi:hypothetical protein
VLDRGASPLAYPYAFTFCMRISTLTLKGIEMKFQDPQTGQIEDKAMPILGTLILGPFFFLINGIWLHSAVWIGLVVGALVMFGDGGIFWLVVIAIYVGYAAATPSIVRGRYLKRGWLELTGSEPSSTLGQKYRKCPFCAEEILAEAVKCKHCGSSVDPLPPPGDPYSRREPVSLTPPTNVSVGEHIERIMAAHGANRAGDGYKWNGKEFGSFTDLVNAINEQQTAK